MRILGTILLAVAVAAAYNLDKLPLPVSYIPLAALFIGGIFMVIFGGRKATKPEETSDPTSDPTTQVLTSVGNLTEQVRALSGEVESLQAQRLTLLPQQVEEMVSMLNSMSLSRDLITKVEILDELLCLAAKLPPIPGEWGNPAMLQRWNDLLAFVETIESTSLTSERLVAAAAKAQQLAAPIAALEKVMEIQNIGPMTEDRAIKIIDDLIINIRNKYAFAHNDEYDYTKLMAGLLTETCENMVWGPMEGMHFDHNQKRFFREVYNKLYRDAPYSWDRDYDDDCNPVVIIANWFMNAHAAGEEFTA